MRVLPPHMKLYCWPFRKQRGGSCVRTCRGSYPPIVVEPIDCTEKQIQLSIPAERRATFASPQSPLPSNCSGHTDNLLSGTVTDRVAREVLTPKPTKEFTVRSPSISIFASGSEVRGFEVFEIYICGSTNTRPPEDSEAV
jgi:hypothetical protein